MKRLSLFLFFLCFPVQTAERVNVWACKETETEAVAKAVVVAVSPALASRIEITVSPVRGLEVRDYLLWITFMSALEGELQAGSFGSRLVKQREEDKSSRGLPLDGRIQSLSLDAREGVS